MVLGFLHCIYTSLMHHASLMLCRSLHTCRMLGKQDVSVWDGPDWQWVLSLSQSEQLSMGDAMALVLRCRSAGTHFLILVPSVVHFMALLRSQQSLPFVGSWFPKQIKKCQVISSTLCWMERAQEHPFSFVFYSLGPSTITLWQWKNNSFFSPSQRQQNKTFCRDRWAISGLD